MATGHTRLKCWRQPLAALLRRPGWILFTWTARGVFRIDIAAPVLTEIFASLIFGLVDAERRGRVARSGMTVLIEQFFLKGASSHQT